MHNYYFKLYLKTDNKVLQTSIGGGGEGGLFEMLNNLLKIVLIT